MASLASDTVASYQRHADKYCIWCIQNCLDDGSHGIYAPTEMDLVYYVCHLEMSKLSLGYIKSHLCGISWWFRMHGLGDVVKHAATGQTLPLLSQVLKGMAKKNVRAPGNARLPMTIPVLRALLAKATTALTAMGRPPTDVVAFVAAATMAVFGLLRVGEFTSSGTKEYVPGKDLLRSDVTVVRNIDGSIKCIKVCLKHTKGDKWRKTQTQTLWPTGNATLCPVTSLAAWLAVRDASGAPTWLPLFTLSDGSYMDRRMFATGLKKSLTLAGYAADKYNTHSCRGGGATTLLSLGHSAGVIKAQGRWASDAWLKYVEHVPEGLQIDIAKNMATVVETSIKQVHHNQYLQRFD